MRLIFVIIFSLILSMAARIALAKDCIPCNQAVYDQIYEALIQQTIKTEDYQRKIEVVEVLKKLCNNQLFSLELGKRHINEN